MLDWQKGKYKGDILKYIKAKDAPRDAVLMGSVVRTVAVKVAYYFSIQKNFYFQISP